MTMMMKNLHISIDSQVILARTNELPEDDTSCVETCRSSLFVISTIIVIDIYVHSLVELKIIKMHGTPIKVVNGPVFTVLFSMSVECSESYVLTHILTGTTSFYWIL